MTIFLGQAITSTKLPKYSYIPDLNLALKKLAREMSRETSPVMPVNHAEGFDPETMTVSDGVHPNENGARHMAAKWQAALQAHF